MSKGVLNGAVRIGKTTYRPGEEDAFAAVASQGQIKHLTKKGAISGDFTSGKKASKSEDAESEVTEEVVEVETAKAPKKK